MEIGSLGREAIKDCFVNHFSGLFKSSRASSSPNLNLEHLIHPTVTEEENQNLCMVHNDVEIKQAIFNKGAIKTPKPNLFVIFLLALLKY